MKNINKNEFALNIEKSNFKTNYESNKVNKLVRHALSKNAISTVTYESNNEENTIFTFSHEVKTLPVCNQKQSGRCWIFAGLNVLREIIAKKLNLKDFELSQNFVALYDKLEKCNYALSSIADLIDNEPDERVLMHVLQGAVSDGGQWDMFKNVVKKYGVMPKNNFNETFQSSATQESNFLINNLIRQFAFEIKSLENKDYSKIKEIKDQYMQKIFNLLTNCFGLPQERFDFEYVNDKNEYHIDKDLTPKSFFDKYIGSEIDEYVSLINSPTKDKPFFKTYTIAYLNNCLDGEDIKHLNVPMDRMKELIKAQLDDNSIVWFGSDVGFYRNRTSGVWDNQSIDYVTPFGFDVTFDKAAMLDFHASVMNHAMCITGYNLKGDLINRWKIENSWGKDVGNQGYYVMSNTWFDHFVYQAVIKKKYLSEVELAALKEEPKVLAPWDPMGTLAD